MLRPENETDANKNKSMEKRPPQCRLISLLLSHSDRNFFVYSGSQHKEAKGDSPVGGVGVIDSDPNSSPWGSKSISLSGPLTPCLCGVWGSRGSLRNVPGAQKRGKCWVQGRNSAADRHRSLIHLRAGETAQQERCLPCTLPPEFNPW